MTDAPGIGTPPRASGWVSLAALLNDAGQLPIDRALHILRAVGKILDDLHERGSVYGALSPAVIQLDADSRPALLLIPDAQAVLAGSAAYYAPEQRRGAMRVDGRADQYAVAIIAYEMLSGRHRQEGTEAGTGVMTLLNEVELVPGRSLRPELQPAANDVLRRAMARNPEHRFATVGAFVAALDRQRVATKAAAELSVLQRLPSPLVLVGLAAAMYVAAASLSIATSAVTPRSVRLATLSWRRTLASWLDKDPFFHRVKLAPAAIGTGVPNWSINIPVPGIAPGSAVSNSGRASITP